MRVMRRIGIGLWAAGLAAAASGASWLVRDGQPRADIVTAEAPMRGAKLAAAELQAGLRRITGAALPFVTAPGSNVAGHVYVGRSAWTDALGVTDAGLGESHYRCVSGEGWLALLGNDMEYLPPEPWFRSRADRARLPAEWERRPGRAWGRRSHESQDRFDQRGRHRTGGGGCRRLKPGSHRPSLWPQLYFSGSPGRRRCH